MAAHPKSMEEKKANHFECSYCSMKLSQSSSSKITWAGNMTGPAGTPYHGGVYHLTIDYTINEQKVEYKFKNIPYCCNVNPITGVASTFKQNVGKNGKFNIEECVTDIYNQCFIYGGYQPWIDNSMATEMCENANTFEQFCQNASEHNVLHGNINGENTAKYFIFPQIKKDKYLSLRQTIIETITQNFNLPNDLIENIIIDCYFGDEYSYCGIDLNLFLKPPSRSVHNKNEIDDYYSKKYGIRVTYCKRDRDDEYGQDLNVRSKKEMESKKGNKILVKTLRNEQYYLYASDDMMLGEFKELIRGEIGVTNDKMKLITRGRICGDFQKWFEYALVDNQVLVLMVKK